MICKKISFRLYLGFTLATQSCLFVCSDKPSSVDRYCSEIHCWQRASRCHMLRLVKHLQSQLATTLQQEKEIIQHLQDRKEGKQGQPFKGRSTLFYNEEEWNNPVSLQTAITYLQCKETEVRDLLSDQLQAFGN